MMIMILFLRRLAELSSQLTREDDYDDDDGDGDGDDDDSLYDKKLYSSFDRAA